jgi:hypothetical protein
MIPADFSAFNNFNIAKHSYWEKTTEEINTFLATGQFPVNNQQTTNNVANVANAYTTPVNTVPAQTVPVQSIPAAAPQYTAPTTPINAPAVAAPETVASTTPARNFSGFSF